MNPPIYIMNPTMKFYDNILNKNNKGVRIMDIDKLYKGKTYVLDIHGTVTIGPLINKIEPKNKYNTENAFIEIEYYVMYFRIGTAKYDGINMEDQVHQYSLQSHLNLPAMQLKIYEYPLNFELQKQIKNYWYYIKTVKNLCVEINISEDIEKMIKSFL